MTSTVFAGKVKVWITPYTPGTDQLSVLRNDYERRISANFSAATGVLELVQKGGAQLTKNDWNEVLNYPTYRLFINVSSILSLFLLFWYISSFVGYFLFLAKLTLNCLVLRLPACLLLQFLSPRACYKFTDGQYRRTFHLQIVDRYGRQSNIVTRNLVVQTGTCRRFHDSLLQFTYSISVACLRLTDKLEIISRVPHNPCVSTNAKSC